MMPSAKIAMRSTAPPGEHVEHAEHAAALRLEGLREGVGIDAGQRDVGAEAVDEQRAQREPDALLQVLGFGEGGEVQIRGKLFSSRRHQDSPLGSRWQARVRAARIEATR